jgi:glycosyltransferase involved in cell wall biosynthesis
MSRGGPRRVLVHAAGALGERLAGPEIRALEFAKALSAEYEVTLAAQRATEGERDGIRVVPSSRRRLLRELSHQDAILSACLPPYLMALAQPSSVVTISDQYDPHEQELATLAAGRERDRELRSRFAIQALQLRYADVVLCASERQRAQLIQTARKLRPAGGAIADPAVVPFGIPDPPPPSGRRPLHEHFPQLAARDTVVLWWGSMWRWLDAETPIRAFAAMADSRSDIKLVITAGKPPSKDAEQRFDATEQMRALASELGVLGRTVLFLDTWIPYEARHDYLGEADIGLTLHRHADEARLAARARYMDYLYAELPCVLGRGDETAEDFRAAGFATLLDEPDANTLAATLQALADDPQALAAARAAGHALAATCHWSAVGETLRGVLAEPLRGGARPAPGHSSLGLLGGAGTYYARQAGDRLATVATR